MPSSDDAAMLRVVLYGPVSSGPRWLHVVLSECRPAAASRQRFGFDRNGRVTRVVDHVGEDPL